MKLVFFDFDGTLTTKDTIWPLASLLSEDRRDRRALRASLLLSLLQLKLGLIPNHTFKARFVRQLVQGRTEREATKLAEEFWARHLEAILNKAVFDLLQNHRSAGDEIYLVSSNFDFFLKPLQQRWKLSGILATQAEVVNGQFTGRITGRACDGKEKLSRVIAAFGEAGVRDAVAYGDSRDDTFLLDFVKTAHWVAPRHRYSGAHPLPTA